MAALTPLRKLALVAVSTVAAVLGAGSAYAASSAAPLASDPSGASIERQGSMRTMLGANQQDRFSTYYYPFLQER
ncbi:hypothetical protein [Streptomyces sp. NPDC048603]|uniref:hypothetical protein n=1 Tax=Streptomyces sp. NPDC048603 TaxID=3365577 RepID=UPI00371A5356